MKTVYFLTIIQDKGNVFRAIFKALRDQFIAPNFARKQSRKYPTGSNNRTTIQAKIQRMKKVFRWLLRQYYKLPDYHGSLTTHSAYGKFRVKYPDGQISQKFSWRVAKNYRNIFGGEIIDAF